ncbi:MAG: hypothetical protein ACRCSJ_06595 [Cetobacterium sp.]
MYKVFLAVGVVFTLFLYLIIFSIIFSGCNPTPILTDINFKNEVIYFDYKNV